MVSYRSPELDHFSSQLFGSEPIDVFVVRHGVDSSVSVVEIADMLELIGGAPWRRNNALSPYSGVTLKLVGFGHRPLLCGSHRKRVGGSFALHNITSSYQAAAPRPVQGLASVRDCSTMQPGNLA
jgi:hypothetical protein